ncbi:hypothetical protein PsYK624_076780 [Phanerochaete sordida]|uniref:Uncharacterized protein n=1 Tax=Phanerochaete sordida TaxID=48140 RepID=A0A9P3LEH8_9APHY|nr:hypothetical protein PsYK624_076780 [Phanerochaete sordida]
MQRQTHPTTAAAPAPAQQPTPARGATDEDVDMADDFAPPRMEGARRSYGDVSSASAAGADTRYTPPPPQPPRRAPCLRCTRTSVLCLCRARRAGRWADGVDEMGVLVKEDLKGGVEDEDECFGRGEPLA